MNLRRAILSDPGRRRDLAAIHVAKKQLGLDDDTYRDMLWAVGRVRSAADLDFAGRRRVLEHLQACGFRQRRPQARDPQSRKVRAVWLELKTLGALRDASEGALAAYVERATGVKALQWLSADQASRVIEQLKAWRKRVSRGQVAQARAEAEDACRQT
jgi:phage gp16-like protein